MSKAPVWLHTSDFNQAVSNADTCYVNHPLAGELKVRVQMKQHPDSVHLPQNAVASIRDLPSFESLGFSESRRVSKTLDGFEVSVPAAALEKTTLAGLTVEQMRLTAHVLSSPQMLEDNAEYMHNCTEGYADEIAAGDKQIVALRDPQGATKMNVELDRISDGTWVVGQINTRFNGFGGGGRSAPDSVRRAAALVAEELNKKSI